MGYIIHSTWSCDFVQEKSVTPPLQEFCLDLNIPEKIDIRDSYFRGCTNGIQLHKMVNDKERIGYVDFCSLYPAVLKYQHYLVGHPNRIVDNFLPLALEKCPGGMSLQPMQGTTLEIPYFGVIKAKILPPKRLLYPILPVRINSKLIFPLCYKCSMLHSNGSCECKDNECSLIHMWTPPKVEFAINHGYRIVDIYEVLHWERFEMIGMKSKKGGIFNNYINMFLTIKAEASG